MQKIQFYCLLPTVYCLLLLLGATVVYGQSAKSLIREGNEMYTEEKYPDAEANYKKALEHKDAEKYKKEEYFNLGDALYKQGRYQEAATQFQIAAQNSKDPVTKAQAYHNIGNSLLQDKKIKQSIEAYKNALKLNPKDMDTKYNLAYANRLLMQPPPEQKQNDQQQDDKEKEDQEQKDQQQNKNQQNQQQDQQDQQKQQPQQRKLSKEEAERLLEAVKNQEKKVQEKLLKKIDAQKIIIEKDW